MRLALALAIVLASVGAVEASWGGLLAPAAPALEAAGLGGVGGTLAGTVGEAPDPPQTNTLDNYDCGGTAPLTLGCSQEFAAPPGKTYRLFTNGGTAFTGTITATLLDATGRAATWTCTYLVFVGGVTAPTCSGSGADLQAGTLRLFGAVTDPASGNPSVGYWEVGVTVS